VLSPGTRRPEDLCPKRIAQQLAARILGQCRPQDHSLWHERVIKLPGAVALHAMSIRML
jgi:hypothetical protein